VALPTSRLLPACLMSALACGGSTPPAAGPVPTGGGAPRPRAIFVLVDPAGARAGQVTASQDAGGVVLEIFATGLAPGRHGMHLHANPACEPPGFQSAGGHFDPTGRQHGARNPQGPHAGDLPNLVVSPSGEGRAQVSIPGHTLSLGPHSIGTPGSALVIHGGEDDELTDPTGNSGPRVACAVIQLP
jgi:Cu-Zn family superoxide dismutase